MEHTCLSVCLSIDLTKVLDDWFLLQMELQHNSLSLIIRLVQTGQGGAVKWYLTPRPWLNPALGTGLAALR